jgi:hypothetical protein
LLWGSIGLGVLAVVLLVVGGLASWHFSSVVLVPDHNRSQAAVDVVGVAPGRITLAHSDEADRPGIYGLDWIGGHAIVGSILSSDEEGVTRRLSHVDGYLVPGTDASFDSDVFAGSPHVALGVPSSSVKVRGELGPMPAWLVPAKAGTRGDWAIVVHGINGTPQEGLRLVPTLRAAGLSSLLITYRDDLGAPSSPDGLHHLGQTEWRDLEAAARYAIDHGARRPAPGPRRLLDGRRGDRAVHGEIPPRAPSRRAGPRRTGSGLAQDPGIPRNGDGPAGLLGDPARVGDRRPHRRR